MDDTKLFLSFKSWYRPGIGKRLSRSPSGCGIAFSISVTNESRQNKVSSEEWSSQLRTQFMQLHKKRERNSGLQLQTKFILFGTQQELGKLVNPTVSILGKTLTPDKDCKDLGIYLDRSVWLSILIFVWHLSVLACFFLLCVKVIEYGISLRKS